MYSPRQTNPEGGTEFRCKNCGAWFEDERTFRGYTIPRRAARRLIFLQLAIPIRKGGFLSRNHRQALYR